MDLMPGAEHDEIVGTVRSFLAARMPATGRGHHHVTTGPELDPDLWRECAELGWLGLGLPESAGGVGYGLVEEMLLFRELGRAVTPGHFLPAVLAAHVAAAAVDLPLAGAIAAGSTLVALGTVVGRGDMGATVHADLSLTHTDRAELVVVCTPIAAALIPAAACSIVPIDPVDGSISTGRGRADGATAIAWVGAEQAPVHAHGLVLAAAAATGVAEAVLALAVEHAGQRVQFGKPIGVNQAIKHRCTDMAVLAEGAFAQACYAAVSVRDRLAGADVEAAIAKYHADEAARTNAEGAVQIHGAMGFTSEALPHRYVYRAHVLARCIESRAALLDRIVPR